MVPSIIQHSSYAAVNYPALECWHIILTSQRNAMNTRTLLVGFFLFAGSLNNAMADNCRANIFGGEDCRYDNGTTSSSRATRA